jgi:hypothetical protein
VSILTGFPNRDFSHCISNPQAKQPERLLLNLEPRVRPLPASIRNQRHGAPLPILARTPLQEDEFCHWREHLMESSDLWPLMVELGTP